MDTNEQPKEPITSLEECKRILKTFLVEYPGVTDFIKKIEQTIQSDKEGGIKKE